MSSTVSSTEIQTIKKMVAMHKMEDKRLVRTSSLEKIKRFNSFICSQQIYVLPALLAWLKSQSVLQSSTERTIFFFRSLVFSHFLYKLYQVDYKALLSNVRVLFQKQIQLQYARVTETEFLLKVGVCLVGSVLATELGLCFYLLSQTVIPSGLVFLIVCWFYIIYLNVRSTHSLDIVMKKNSGASRS